MLRVWDEGNFKGSLIHFWRNIIDQMPMYQCPNLFRVGVQNSAFEQQRPFSVEAPEGQAPVIAGPQPETAEVVAFLEPEPAPAAAVAPVTALRPEPAVQPPVTVQPLAPEPPPPPRIIQPAAPPPVKAEPVRSAPIQPVVAAQPAVPVRTEPPGQADPQIAAEPAAVFQATPPREPAPAFAPATAAAAATNAGKPPRLP